MKNSKIVSSKTTSALFLATVLVAGTVAAIYPSFMIYSTQAQPYYGKMDNKYSNYGPPQYPDNNYYNSYEPDYEIDTYELQYPSYGKDDNSDKIQKNIKSIDINKLKCINNNLNINGNNAGNVSIGNKGQGYLDTYGSDGNGGYGGSEGYYDGQNKKDKGFDCIINNNNNNINVVGGNNQTEKLTCEECFTENLSAEQLNNLTIALSASPVDNLEGLCEQFLSNSTLTNQEKLFGLSIVFSIASITDVDAILRVLECLDELGLIIVPPNFDPILH